MVTHTDVLLRGLTWDHVRGFDPMVATAQIYCEKNPNVRIIWEKRSLQAFADRQLEDMVVAYDLLVIDHPHVGAAAAGNELLAFNGSGRDADLRVLAGQSLGRSHASYEFNNNQWGLAIDTAAPVAAYRPDLIDYIPQRWEEVVRLAELGRVIWPLKPVDAVMSFFNLLANVGEPFGANGQGANQATGVRIINEMKSVVKYLPHECLDMNPIGAYEWLAGRSSHSYVPYLYGYSNYSRENFRPNVVKSTNIACIGNLGPIGSTLGGAGLAVSAGTKHADIAIDYALWVASAECQQGPYFISGGQPGNADAWDDEEVNRMSNNFFKDTRATLEQSYLRPRYLGYLDFQNTAGDLINRCLRGESSVAHTVETVNDVFHRSLDNVITT